MSDKRTGKKLKSGHQPKTPANGAVAIAPDAEAANKQTKGGNVRTAR